VSKTCSCCFQPLNLVQMKMIMGRLLLHVAAAAAAAAAAAVATAASRLRGVGSVVSVGRSVGRSVGQPPLANGEC
jgi:hypothetical protein